MNRKLLIVYFILGIAVTESQIPTSLQEIESFERLFEEKSNGDSIPEQKQMEPTESEKFQSLINKIEDSKRTDSRFERMKYKKNKRSLLLAEAGDLIGNTVESVATPFQPIGRMIEPITQLAGVENRDDGDAKALGLGTAAFGLGLLNKMQRDATFEELFKVIENKYHLNNLFLDSIQKQNVQAEFSDKSLRKIVKRVDKLRESLLAKIHSASNPLN